MGFFDFMYPTTKLGDLVTIKGGKRLPKGEEFLLAETTHPYIRAQDIKGGKVSLDDPLYISDETFQKIKR